MLKKAIISFCLCLGGLYGLVVEIHAGPMVSNAKLLSPNMARYNQFGGAVDISPDGTTALVGEHRMTRSGDTGVAYYFPTLSSEGLMLPQGDLIPQTAYGRAVAMSDDGTTAVIGAPWTDNGINYLQGAAYILSREGSAWVMRQKLVDTDPGEYEFFGESVDISDNGDTIIIGGSGDHDARGVGAASIFIRTGNAWTLQQKLKAADGQALDFFGYSVALSGDGSTAIVGMPWDSLGGSAEQGAVYVFVRSGSTWMQQAKITALDGWSDDHFGSAVDLSDDGNTALIGANWKNNGDGTGLQRGAAYIFTRSNGNWSQQTKLLAADGAQGDWFGTAVALSNNGNTAVVGAVFAEAAYLYGRRGSSWALQDKLTTTDPDVYSFGVAVAVSDDGQTVLVGADEATVSGVEGQGAVYIFRPFVPMTGPNMLLLNSP